MAMENDLKKGYIGELVVADYFKRNGWEVISVAKDQRSRDYDIDFIIKDKETEQIQYIEVKTNYTADKPGKFNNKLIFEKVSSKTFNTQGWLDKTHADYIYFFIPGNGRMYAGQPKVIRQYINGSHIQLEPLGDDGLVYVIDIDTLLKNNIIEKISL